MKPVEISEILDRIRTDKVKKKKKKKVYWGRGGGGGEKTGKREKSG